MPNPRFARDANDLPLDEAMGYATHVVIRCAPPVAERRCGHRAIWMTSDLYAKLPNCRTLREFKERLYCKKCLRRGWLEIEPAGR